MRFRHLAVVALSLATAACGAAAAGTEPGDPTGDPTGDPAGDRSSDPGVRVVTVDEASEMLGESDRMVIDVRTPEEFAEGHLAGARNIDINGADFADAIGALDPDASYLVYCRSANRSAGARQLMTELGFRDVADIAGGTIAWTEAGLPLDR